MRPPLLGSSFLMLPLTATAVSRPQPAALSSSLKALDTGDRRVVSTRSCLEMIGAQLVLTS